WSQETLLVMGRTLRNLAGPDGARPLLKRAVTLYPENMELHLWLGQAYGFARPPRWDEAVRHFTAAWALNPRNPAALLNLGNAFSELHRYDDAIPILRAATLQVPGHEGSAVLLARALKAKGALVEATDVLQKAVQLAPDAVVAWSELGAVWSRRGALD